MINELLFIGILLISFTIVLVSIKFGKEWIMIIPAVFLIIANIFAPQLISAFGFTTSLAIPLYAAIFLATDIVAEHWGKKEATKIVWSAFFAQIALIIFSQLITHAEVLGMSQQLNEGLKVVFSLTPRLVLGSIIAYVISQNWDIWVFHKLKEITRGKHVWLRNNVSTITSQFLDSFIFIFIGFYGILPNLILFAISVWIVKVLVALLDTPFIYLSYKILDKRLPLRSRHFRNFGV